MVAVRISGMILSSSSMSSSVAVKAGGQRDCSPSVCGDPDELDIECEIYITYMRCIYEIGTAGTPTSRDICGF